MAMQTLFNVEQLLAARGLIEHYEDHITHHVAYPTALNRKGYNESHKDMCKFNLSGALLHVAPTTNAGKLNALMAKMDWNHWKECDRNPYKGKSASTDRDYHLCSLDYLDQLIADASPKR